MPHYYSRNKSNLEHKKIIYDVDAMKVSVDDNYDLLFSVDGWIKKDSSVFCPVPSNSYVAIKAVIEDKEITFSPRPASRYN